MTLQWLWPPYVPCSAGELFRALSSRYVACQRTAAGPAASPTYEPRNIYGFDVATMHEDTVRPDMPVSVAVRSLAGSICQERNASLLQVFVLLYTIHILNADLRSAAVKRKMSRAAYVARNASVDCLRHIPVRFFEGLYDEIAVQGLPINDRVSMAPVTHASLEGSPFTNTVNVRVAVALRPLVRSNAHVVVEHAGAALSWLRQTVARVVLGPVPLYRV